MIFKIRIGSWRFTFTFAPVVDVTGVNSKLKDGNHILMWDFDDVPLYYVEADLKWLQKQHNLPNIYILNTGKPKHHIAYCFRRSPWEVSVAYIAQSLFVDRNFFKYGVYRERWTLRVTPKEGRKPKLVKTLLSPIPESASISELESWVKDISHGTLVGVLLFLAMRPAKLPKGVCCVRLLDMSAQDMRPLLMQH